MMGSVISVVSEAFIDYRGSRLRSRATISSRWRGTTPFLCGERRRPENSTGLSAFQIRSNEENGRGEGTIGDVGVTPVRAGKRGSRGARKSSVDRRWIAWTVNQRRYACLLERKSVCPEMIGKFNGSRYQLSHTRDLFRRMESAKRFYLVSRAHLRFNLSC